MHSRRNCNCQGVSYENHQGNSRIWFRLGESWPSNRCAQSFHCEACVKADAEKIYSLIIGLVSEPGHVFEGLWVLIAVRTRGAEPTYNIFLYSEKPPFYRGENVDPLCIPIAASGYAMLEP
jgi:hypothetical protein